MQSASSVDDLARTAGDAHLAAVIENPVADPRRLAGLRVDLRDIRDVDRQLLVDDSARLAEPLPRVTARDMDTLHDHPVLVREHAQHLAALALVATADDDDVVALLDLELCHRSQYL